MATAVLETTSSKKHAQLKVLAKKCRDAIFDMLRLTDEILSDSEYTCRFGNADKLLEIIEADEFAHFGGRPSLAQMLIAYRANPDRETWRRYRYNIQAMIDLSRPAKETDNEPRTNWKVECQRLAAEVEQLKAMLADYIAKCDALQRENGELTGTLKDLRRRLGE